MRKHTVRAVTWLLSAAMAVSLFVVGTSAAVADSGGQGGRGYVSGGRQATQSTGRMGRSMRRGRGGGRYDRDRGGRRFGWFSRDRRNYDRRGYDRRNYSGTFISFGRGSYRRGYRSSGAFFFGFSFTASEYRSGSGLRYRRDPRREYRSDAGRENNSSGRRAIEHSSNQPGPLYAPLIASPAAPEILPLKD